MMEGLHLGFKRGIQQLYPNSLASKWSKTSHASVWLSCWLIPSGIEDWTGKFTSRIILKKRCINFEVRLFFKWINWICLLLDFIGTNNLLYVQLGNIMCAFFWRVKLYCISGKISDRYLKSKVLVVMLSSCENLNYKIICYSKYWCEILFLPLILILTYIICHENRDSFFLFLYKLLRLSSTIKMGKLNVMKRMLNVFTVLPGYSFVVENPSKLQGSIMLLIGL